MRYTKKIGEYKFKDGNMLRYFRYKGFHAHCFELIATSDITEERVRELNECGKITCEKLDQTYYNNEGKIKGRL